MAKVGRKPGQKSRVKPATARDRALALSLSARGLTLAEIVSRLGGRATKSTVHRWIQEAESSAKVPLHLDQEAQRLAEEPAATLDVDGLDVAAIDEEIRDVSEMRAKAKERGDAMDFVRLSKLKAELVVARFKVRPPVQPDPNADPANVAARDLVRAKLRDLVEIFARQARGEAA